MNNNLTVVIDRFLESLKARNYSIATIKSRQGALKRFISFLADNHIKRFQDVSLEVFEDYRLFLIDSDLSENTVDSYLWAIRSLFDYLDDQSLIFENPTRDIEIHRKSSGLRWFFPWMK